MELNWETKLYTTLNRLSPDVMTYHGQWTRRFRTGRIAPFPVSDHYSNNDPIVHPRGAYASVFV